MRSTKTKTITVPEGYAQQAAFREWAHEACVVNLLAPIIREGREVVIVTHKGRFHGDDNVGCAILLKLIAELGGTAIIRRVDRDDQEALDAADIQVDIGGEFNPSRGRFDHHQAGGAGYRYTRRGVDIPFSSCGLVWLSCGLFLTDLNVEVFEHIDWNLIRGLCASDNGATMPNGFRFEDQHGIQREVPGSPSHLSDEIGKMNDLPAYDSFRGQLYDPEASRDEQKMAKFMIALKEKAYTSLICNLEQAMKGPAARKAIESALPEMQSGVLVLPNVRWQGELSKVDGHRQVRIVIREANEGYELKCLYSLKAPVAWRGLSNGELLSVTGIQGLKFCHHGGQIIGAESREAALAAAKVILQEHRRVAA